MASRTQSELDALHQQVSHLTERVLQLTTINQISQAITSRLDLRAVFQTAVSAIHAELRHAYVAAGLVDRDDPELLVLYAQAGRYTSSIPDDYRQSIHAGIVGAAARTRQPVLVNDVRQHGQYLAMPDAATIVAELAVPIMLEDELLGVLNIESERPLTPVDTASIRAVADQLAIALDNAQRYADEQRRTERLGLVARLGHLIAARRDPTDLFATTVAELHTRLGYEHVALLLPDADDHLVQRTCLSRWPATNEPEPGIVAEAARQRQTIVSTDVRCEGQHPAHPTIRALLAVPIVLEARVLGVLHLQTTRSFEPDDVAGIQIVADQLAVAIENAQLFDRISQTLDDVQLLYRTSQQLGVALAIDQVIEAYLGAIAARGRYLCTIVLYDQAPDRSRRAVIVRGRWTPTNGVTLHDERLPYVQDALDPVLDAGETVLITNVAYDSRVNPELRAMQQRVGRPALALIPLIARGERLGLVVLSHDRAHAWPEDQLRIYQTTAAQLAIAIDMRQQQRLLAERNQQLAVFEERRRLARDLHDSVTQLVFGITLIAQSIAPVWQRDPAAGERRIARLIELSQQALAEMRSLLAELQELAPEQPLPGPGLTILRQDGLVTALDALLATATFDGLVITVRVESYTRQAHEHEEALFRIIQEALHNVAKHAAARHVTIALDSGATNTTLRITDDGRGFAAEQTAAAGHYGLASIRERAMELHGSCGIVSTPGGGTTIAIELPRSDWQAV